MSNVRHFGEKSGTVAMLEEILAEARKGNIRGLVVGACFTNGWRDSNDGPGVGTFVSHSIDDFYAVLGALDELKFNMLYGRESDE